MPHRRPLTTSLTLLLLSLTLLLTPIVALAYPQPKLLPGDANCDGKVDAVDLLVMKRHILEIYLLPRNSIAFQNADVKAPSGSIDAVDLLAVTRHVLELEILRRPRTYKNSDQYTP